MFCIDVIVLDTSSSHTRSIPSFMIVLLRVSNRITAVGLVSIVGKSTGCNTGKVPIIGNVLVSCAN